MTTRTHTKGMTLVELLVTVALFTLMMLVITNGIAAMYKYNAYTFAQAYQVENARNGMQELIRDIREMTFADNGTFPLAEMEPHLIGFYSDIDRDDSVEYVRYELVASTTLTKRVFNATGTPPTYNLTTPDESITLSQHVQNFTMGSSTFRYYDQSGGEVTTLAGLTDVRYIVAEIIVNIDPVRDPGQFMLRSSATLRNIKENI